MQKLTLYSHSSRETIDFARKLACFLKKGNVVGLFGNLGSGKTTFIKGLAQGLGLKAKINSPGFVILKIYSFKRSRPSNRHISNKIILLYHFDLYRLRSLKELEDIGYKDFIYNSGICVIEWADKARKLLPKDYLKIEIKIKGENGRKINIVGYGIKYDNLITKIENQKKGE